MAEHLIRLRGGWSWLEPGRSSGSVAEGAGRRLTLPLDGPQRTGLPRLVRLVRGFGLPPVDLMREELALRLEVVEGLQRVHLNGRDLARPPSGTRALELVLEDPLPSRNLLVLDVDFGAWDSARAGPWERPAPWGSVALVIRARETGSENPARGPAALEAEAREPGIGDHPLGEMPTPP